MTNLFKFLKIFIILISVLGGGLYYLYNQLPDTQNILKCHFTKMHKVWVCSRDLNYVSIKNVSSHLIQSVLVSEDVSFFHHNGFEFSEIKNSFFDNLMSLRYKRGASTITQQLVKNNYLNSEKSISRKIKEALLTYKIEKELSKEKILELYLNIVQFGKNIYGLSKASQHYFNTSPINLTLVQSSLLAYLLPNPEFYSKIFTQKKWTTYSLKKSKNIITKLYLFKRITEDEKNNALDELDNYFKSPDQ